MNLPASSDFGPGRRARFRTGLRLGVALVLLALVVAWVGPARLMAQLANASAQWFAAALACAIGANLLSAWRWGLIARALGLAAPLPRVLSAYAQGIAVNTVLPGATLGGDALRALRLSQMGNDALLAAASVVIDRASGLWVLCAVSLLAVVALLATTPLTAPGSAGDAALSMPLIAMLAAGLLLLLALPVFLGPGREGSATSPTRARWQHLRALLHARRRVLVRSLLPSIGVQLLSAGTLWLCVRAAGADASAMAVFAIAAPVFLAAAIPVTVGGFGPREAAAAIVFTWIGAAPEVGVAAAVLYGAASAVQGVLGAPLLAWSPARH